MPFARKTRPRWHTPIGSQRIPLASFTGGTQEIGSIHSERFCHGPESFEAGTKNPIIFEAPNRMRSDTHSLGKSFLCKSQLHAPPAKPSSLRKTLAFGFFHAWLL